MLRNYIFFDSGLQTSRLAGHGFDPDAWRHEMPSDASSISAQGNIFFGNLSKSASTLDLVL